MIYHGLDAFALKLAVDLIEQILAEPFSADTWHRLHEHYLASTSEALRNYVQDCFLGQEFLDAEAEILRLTFLRDIRKDLALDGLIGQKALLITPGNPDRLLALASSAWGNALQHTASQTQCIEQLETALVPQLIEQLTKDAKAQMPRHMVSRKPAHIKRVAIVAQCLGNQWHTPSMTVLRQCESLVKQGFSVKIFCCQELQPPNPGKYFGSLFTAKAPPVDYGFWQQALPTGVQLKLSDQRFSLPGRWRDMFTELDTFDPDLVLTCGLFSPLAAAMHRIRPVVALNVHAFQPIGHADLWLSSISDEARNRMPRWSTWRNAPLSYYHPFRVKKPEFNASTSRLELGIPESSLVWISIGARLTTEITVNWAAQIFDRFNRQPNAVWLIIGPMHCPPALRNFPADRIKVLGPRSDIASLLNLSDLYVNPPRTGGGFSVAEAMSLGLPVVSMKDSDGGDKLGPLAVTSSTQYVERLADLCANPALRVEHGQALKSRFDQSLNLDHAGSSILNAFNQALELANHRLHFTQTQS